MLIIYSIFLVVVLIYGFINIYHAIRYATDLDGRIPWMAIFIYVLGLAIVIGVGLLNGLTTST